MTLGNDKVTGSSSIMISSLLVTSSTTFPMVKDCFLKETISITASSLKAGLTERDNK